MSGAIALSAGLNRFTAGDSQGNFTPLATPRDVYAFTRNSPVLLCNRSLIKGRLGTQMPRVVLDVLELFAFVCPACPVVPTIKELARFLNMTVPVNGAEEVRALFSMVRILLGKLAALDPNERKKAVSLALAMTRSANWIWGADVLSALGTAESKSGLAGLTGFAVWDGLPDWTESAPAEPAGTLPVLPDEAGQRLSELLSRADSPETRADQVAYSRVVSKAFNPRSDAGFPVSVLAQAGTGIGKTLGYLAPASVWSDKNAGSVWISTFTRTLQKQLDSELSRVFPDPQIKRRAVVIRKGRENYMCLLNFAEAVGRIPANPMSALPLGLIARWVAATKDGDMNGGDFPGWMADMINAASLANLADKRGECLYAQCPHYKKCFVEKILRRSRHAKIVVANHALVMTQLAGATEDIALPTRYLFDEGHQLFAAADDIFAGEINVREGLEMRRILFGTEDAKKTGRTHGLRRRAEDLILLDPDIAAGVDELLEHASFLPQGGALARIKNRTPSGEFERFLTQIYRQVLARTDKTDAQYSLECEPRPVDAELSKTAVELYGDIKIAETAAYSLIGRIERYIDKNAGTIETADKQRYSAVIRSLRKTVAEPLSVWRVMLEQLDLKTPADFVDKLEITRTDGLDTDVGYHRHWVDPTIPFAHVLGQAAHGVLVTSATLKDNSGDSAADWKNALKRTGLAHFQSEDTLTTAAYKSPFDYANNSRIFIITDVDKNDAAQVAAAYRELFLASNGGALGIFTAIRRLKDVYRRLKEPLGANGIDLLAQHVDTVSLQTLLDIFRAEEETCLLGTDAVRDGIDVPGKSLRMIVFDRVPWNRPDIAHKARKAAFGEAGEAYNLMLVRMKLAQAFGRLIRKHDDKGVFVMLDRALPSETLTAFPPETPIEKTGLKDALLKIKEFLG